MKKYIFVFLFCCFSISSVFAKTEEIKASGTGASEYSATINAIDNAIRQSSRVKMGQDQKLDLSETNLSFKDTRKIESETSGFLGKESYKSSGGEVELSVSEINREVGLQYKGSIEKYEVISSKKKGNTYTVKIKATVIVADEYKSPDLGQKAKYRVAILSSDTSKKWDCLGKSKNSNDIEKKIDDEMSRVIVSSKKMSVVDRKNIDKQLRELSLLDADIADPSNLNKLRKTALADYLLITQIDSFENSKTKKHIEMTGENVVSVSANLEVSYKLIETATMDIISSQSETRSFSVKNDASCQTVISSLTKNLGKSIANKMLVDLFPDYKTATETTTSNKAPVAKVSKPVMKMPWE